MMSAQNGQAVRLKIGNAGSPVESFSELCGLVVCGLFLEQRLSDASDVSSGAWRKHNAAQGLRDLRIDAEGVFEDSAAEEALRAQAFGGAARNYQLVFANGDTVSGSFIVASYSRNAALREAEAVAIRLQSAGAIAFATS